MNVAEPAAAVSIPSRSLTIAIGHHLSTSSVRSLLRSAAIPPSDHSLASAADVIAVVKEAGPLRAPQCYQQDFRKNPDYPTKKTQKNPDNRK